MVILGLSGCGLLGSDDLQEPGVAVTSLDDLTAEAGSRDVTDIAIHDDRVTVGVVNGAGTDVETWQWKDGDISRLDGASEVYEGQLTFPVDSFDLSDPAALCQRAQEVAESTGGYPYVRVHEDKERTRPLLSVYDTGGEPDPVYFTTELAPVAIVDITTADGIATALDDLTTEQGDQVTKIGSLNDLVYIHVVDESGAVAAYQRAESLPVTGKAVDPEDEGGEVFDSTTVDPTVIETTRNDMAELTDIPVAEVWQWDIRRPDKDSSPVIRYDVEADDGTRFLVTTDLDGGDVSTAEVEKPR